MHGIHGCRQLAVICWFACAVGVEPAMSQTNSGSMVRSAEPRKASPGQRPWLSERSVAELCHDVRSTLGVQAAAVRNRDWPAWEQATRRLADLNDELRTHSRRKTGTQLAKLKKTVEARLAQARLKISGNSRSATDAPQLADNSTFPPSGLVIPITQRLLAQQIQLPIQQGAVVGGGVPANGAAPPGPGGVAGDYSDDLISLIERTVQADIWQSVGGPAAIAYYQPSLALVISAPGDVHDGVVDLLYQLRRANGP